MRGMVRNYFKDIERLEIFESALKGEVESNKINIYNDNSIDIEHLDLDKVSNIVKEYNKFYSSIAYPFNYIQEDMKYHFIAKYMEQKIKGIEYYIDKCLTVIIKGNEVAIKFVDGKYVFVQAKGISDRTLINIDNFKDSKYYKEYSFIYSAIKLKGDIKPIVLYMGIYKDICSECSNSMESIEEYIRSLSVIRELPCFQRIPDNLFLDLEDKAEYTMEIYTSGVKKTGENKYVLSQYKDLALKPKYTEVYDYKVRKRKKEVNNGYTKYIMSESDLLGFHYIFNKIVGIKKGLELDGFPIYRGLIVDRNIIFELGDSVYIVKAYRKGDVEEIVSGGRLLGVKDNKVYYSIKVIDKNKNCTIKYYAYVISKKEHEIVKTVFL